MEAQSTISDIVEAVVPKNFYRVLLVIFGLITGLLTLVNLEGYPHVSDWDEGFYLQFTRNLAKYGEYATLNNGFFEQLVPVGGTGPGVIVPVALAQAATSNDFVAARLVVVGFTLIALVGTFSLSRKIGGSLAALVSILFFLSAGHTTYDTLWIGRQVLAETPALAFVLVGLLLWIKGWQRSIGWLICAAVLFGCAVATKNQVLYILVPAIGLIFLTDRLYYHQLRWRDSLIVFIGAILGYVFWTFASYLIIGAAHWPEYSVELQNLTFSLFGYVSPLRWFENTKLLASSGQAFLVVPAIVYGLYRSRARSRDGLLRAIVPVLACVALGVFVFSNLPWTRYIYFSLVLSVPCIAVMVADGTQWLSHRAHLSPRAALCLVVFLAGCLTAPRLINDAQRIVVSTNDVSQNFAIHIDSIVPQNKTIYNWEWSIELYSQRSFVHPSFKLFPVLIDRLYNNKPNPDHTLERIPSDIDYIIVGPFADRAGMYTDLFHRSVLTLLVREGEYRLYHIERPNVSNVTLFSVTGKPT